MREFINTSDNRATIRWKLLTGASALALTAYVSAGATAKAEDAAAPQVWLELGGQLERMSESGQIFAPPFTQSLVTDGLLPENLSQQRARYSSGFEGAIQFQPEDSNWNFSASIRYGRSNASNASHNQTSNPASGYVIFSIPALDIHVTNNKEPHSRKFGDTAARNHERHSVLDFQAGRDVGLGLFGGKSTLDIGVRFAQFASKSNALITANSGPDWLQGLYLTSYYGYSARIVVQTEGWDVYHAKANINANFKGIGPSLAFKTSIPLAGNDQNGQLGFDLGINGSLLFGRQKTRVHQETKDERPYIPHFYNFIPLVSHYHHSQYRVRSRSVTVPNAGGFAAISFQYVDAKISLGYRADFFFNAIDGGIDTAKKENRGFFGPYASISVGLGD